MTIFHANEDNRQVLYEKELKFGRIMLKRAKRELGYLDEQIKVAQNAKMDAHKLEVEFAQLNESIHSFEDELAAFQHIYEDRDWLN